MATALAIGGNRVLNINCGDEEQQVRFDQGMERLQRDADTMAAIEQAADLEEVYEALKKYCSLKFEEFEQVSKVILEKMKSDISKQAAERELDDDELDMVVGGSWWGTFWKVAAIVGATVVGAALCGVGAAAVMSLCAAGAAAFWVTVGVSAAVGAAIGGVSAADLTGVLESTPMRKR